MLKPFLEIGKIVSVHGIKGELRVQPWCDSADFLKKFKTLYLDKDGKNCIEVLSCRPHGNIVILKLKGIETPEQAQKMRGTILFMDRKDSKLESGQYFVQDLIGCKAVDADDESRVYGTISDVSQTGANDVWHIKAENAKEYLIPAIPQVVVETDIENEIVRIRPLKGIFDGEVNGDAD